MSDYAWTVEKVEFRYKYGLTVENWDCIKTQGEEGGYSMGTPHFNPGSWNFSDLTPPLLPAPVPQAREALLPRLLSTLGF